MLDIYWEKLLSDYKIILLRNYYKVWCNKKKKKFFSDLPRVVESIGFDIYCNEICILEKVFWLTQTLNICLSGLVVLVTCATCKVHCLSPRQRKRKLHFLTKWRIDFLFWHFVVIPTAISHHFTHSPMNREWALSMQTNIRWLSKLGHSDSEAVVLEKALLFLRKHDFVFVFVAKGLTHLLKVTFDIWTHRVFLSSNIFSNTLYVI